MNPAATRGIKSEVKYEQPDTLTTRRNPADVDDHLVGPARFAGGERAPDHRLFRGEHALGRNRARARA